ncbi:UNVERIFIED_CONTAM: hypothetical protein NCL1_31260 [Trichonephila clavipes]
MHTSKKQRIIHSFQWFVLILATVQAQYDYYSDEQNAEEEYEEPIDPEYAKEFICKFSRKSIDLRTNIKCAKINLTLLKKYVSQKSLEEICGTSLSLQESDLKK